MPDFFEFFAGGGMARAGLGPGWTCRFANEFDPKKAASYQANWGEDCALKIADVATLTVADLPGTPDLVWASFPCQDLSLAGAGAGLKGARSGTFFPFWRLMQDLAADGRAPKIIALENVTGALASRQGQDFAALCKAFDQAGYRAGALTINADRFLPQSRPRLFVVGVSRALEPHPDLLRNGPEAPFHGAHLSRAVERLPKRLREGFLWWSLPEPPRRNTALADLIEPDPPGARWKSAAETDRLMALMAPLHLERVEAARRAGRRQVGAVYRRTRRGPAGERVQRAEVRFDGLAGCLRTPAGGSSRQTILVVEDGDVRARLLTARETARLMGLDDDYRLPASYNEAYHLTGDGVAVPVVRHLARWLFEPLLLGPAATSRAAG